MARSLRGNLILAREIDELPFTNALQGIGCFDGPLVHFTVESDIADSAGTGIAVLAVE